MTANDQNPATGSLGASASPSQGAGSGARALSPSQKAAMVVQLLLKEGDDLPLTAMPEHVQERLTREIGSLGVVDRTTLDDVVEEFVRALSNLGLAAPGSVEAALQSLEGRISPTAMARLRAESAGTQGHDPWSSVLALEAEHLLPITEAESPEVAAVLLSKLPTARAAELLGLMPGERARRIAYAMSRTTAIRADAIGRIGHGLAQAYCGITVPAFPDPPENRMGAILNSSGASLRDTILSGLLEDDEGFGSGVRKAIFTFEDIPSRLEAMDVPKVLRDIDQAELVRALASATEAGGGLATAANHLLDNMSTRMADNLREEMGEVGSIKTAEAEAAQTSVVSAIRAVADAGEITLLSDDDEG
ncbi:MAG: FliG C-terminal domain-containing protein [Pseudomonadota bacterium]